MLLKGAYCVGEHFVDPQGLLPENIVKTSLLSTILLQHLRFILQNQLFSTEKSIKSKQS